MIARKSMTDKVRLDYRVYMEPVLARACEVGAVQVGCRTVSRYIRRAVILQAIADGYPLEHVSLRLAPIAREIKGINKGVSQSADVVVNKPATTL